MRELIVRCCVADGHKAEPDEDGEIATSSAGESADDFTWVQVAPSLLGRNTISGRVVGWEVREVIEPAADGLYIRRRTPGAPLVPVYRRCGGEWEMNDFRSPMEPWQDAPCTDADVRSGELVRIDG